MALRSKDGDPKGDAAWARRLPETERLLKQFRRLESGPGNATQYRVGWCRTFGRRTGDHSGQVEPGDAHCDDLGCWCARDTAEDLEKESPS